MGVVLGFSLLVGAGFAGSALAAPEAPDCSTVSLDGSGTAADPFRVETLDQLQCLGQTAETSLGFGDHYQLQTDIDASETATWNGGAGFEPIASGQYFYGTFDGNGFTISNLHIDRPDTERVGLFARLFDLRLGNVTLESARITGGGQTGGLLGFNEGGTVHNASVDGTISGGGETGGLVGSSTGTVTNSSATASVDGGDSTGGLAGYSFDTVRNSSAAGSVDGTEQVGGLVGFSRGDVHNSSATGDVNGSQSIGGLLGESQGAVTESSASGDVTSNDVFVGGFVGLNYGDVNESYATGSVTADGYLGGFVGNNEADVNNSYAAGSVTSGTAQYIGGFAGTNRDGTISRSYWDYERSGRLDGVGTIGRGEGPGDVTDLSTTDMQGSAFETRMSDLFATGAWTSVAGDYPDLVHNPRTLSTPHYDYPSGSEMDTILAEMETVDGDKIVTSDKALQAINRNSAVRSDDYRLGLDIDASGTDEWNSGTGFLPIGYGGNEYSGSFDGDGHVISGLSIDRAADDIGLFSAASEGSTIDGVGIESVDISGNSQVGGLVGTNDGGTVRDSSVTGTVAGDDLIGGLIGQYSISTGDPGGVNGSSAAVTVSGDVFVGGLIGSRNSAGVMNGSSATGNVSGTRGIGGLIGTNNGGAIRQSYATGRVTGIDGDGGGLGSKNFGGLIGVMRETTVDTSYATGGVDGSGDFTGGLVGTIARFDGDTASLVRNSSATGDIDGSGDFTGGLVGTNTDSNVTVSYTTGNVTGLDYVGGLVGQNDGGTVNSSYATGAIDGTGSVGGAVGDDTGTVEAVYWDAETTTQSASSGSDARYGLPTERMTGLNATVGMFEFDFEDTWQPAATAGSYPVLASNSSLTGKADAYDALVDGDGSADDPYRVSTVYELQLLTVRLGMGDAFELVSDINASRTVDWNDEGRGPLGFEPIGNETTGFDGTFDGNGYAITDVVINRSSTDSVGLFGVVGASGTVSSVAVDSATVTGNDDVGGLVGANSGTVTNSSVSGRVNGTTGAGGLVGWSRSGATVTRSWATGDVNGTDLVGGAIGRQSGTARMVAAAGTVDGDGDVGGLVGRTLADGDLRQSYATGPVVSGTDVGGLVGVNDGGTVANTFATGNASGTTAGGLVGRNQGAIRLSYATGAVDGSATAGGLTGTSSAAGTVEDSYWDTSTTTQQDAVGSNAGTATNLTAFGTSGGAVPAPEMQGLAAVENMTALDFTTPWTAVDGSPVLAWSVEALALTLTDDNVSAGESTTANVMLTLVENTTDTATATSQYSSNDSGVAVIDSAGVEARDGGVALLTAELAGVTGSAPVSVTGELPDDGPDIRATDESTIEVTGSRTRDVVRISERTTDADGLLGERGAVGVDALSVELADDRDFWLSVETFEGGNASDDDTADQHSDDGSNDSRSAVSTAFETETGTLSAGYVTVTHNLDEADIRSATFEFSVREARLAELGVHPENITLYRQSDGWTALPTDYRGMYGTEARFEAVSPGFSSFAIGTGKPRTVVTGVTGAETELVAGAVATVTATVENRGASAAERTLNLTANGETVATETLTLGPGETTEVALSFEPAAGTYALAVADRYADSLAVVDPPTTEPPATAAPTTDALTTDAPAPATPTSDGPTTDAPISEVPAPDAPSTASPMPTPRTDDVATAVDAEAAGGRSPDILLPALVVVGLLGLGTLLWWRRNP